MKLDFDPRNNMSAFAYFTAKIDNKIDKIIDKINGLLSMRKTAKNWIEVALFRIGLKKTLTIKFRDGKTAYFENRRAYFSFWKQELGQNELLKTVKNTSVKSIHYKSKSNNIELEYQNKKIRFYYDTTTNNQNTINLINENFIGKQYKWLDVEGKDVVDIGANIGDTAIYFALRGARHVYAFEPYPYSYNIATKNIRLNHLEDKITLLNEGCGKGGFVTIQEDYENTSGTDLKNFKEGKKIKIENLDEIVKRFNLKHAALKVDCEGCEYDLILNASDEALKAFDWVIIEYHYGYRNLARRLKRTEFKVKYSLPKYSHNIEAEDSNMYVGFIFATSIR